MLFNLYLCYYRVKVYQPESCALRSQMDNVLPTNTRNHAVFSEQNGGKST